LKAIKPIPNDNFNDALAQLNYAQVTGDYIYEARRLAGPLIAEVGHVFPLHKIIIYMVTCRKRRQVWHAWLSMMVAGGMKPDPEDTLYKLLHWRSHDLLVDAFGFVPEGYQGALERLGLIGQQPHIYKLLHRFMCESDAHKKAFRHSSKIKAQTIEFMALMPIDLRSVRLAEKFAREKDVKALVFAVTMLACNDPARRLDLCSRITHAADRGGSVTKIIEQEYYKTAFPAQAVPDSANLCFVKTVDELLHVSRHMKNCFAQYQSEAIRGDYQYYVWLVDSEPVAAISIKEDRPFGWRIVELQGPENGMPEERLSTEIIDYFAQYRVFNMPDMESLICGIGHALRDDNDPSSNINELINGMLEEDDAAA